MTTTVEETIWTSVVHGAVHGATVTDLGGRHPMSVSACGFTAAEARRGALARYHAARALQEAANGPTAVGPGPVRALCPADFVPGGAEPGAAPPLPALSGVGAVSGLRYLVPARIFFSAPVPAAVREPVLDGAATPGPALAEVLALDVAARWWRHPHTRLTDATVLLSDRLPEEVRRALPAQGLTAEAFLWTSVGFALGMVVMHRGDGEAASFGVSGRETPGAALENAFLKAMAARLGRPPGPGSAGRTARPGAHRARRTRFAPPTGPSGTRALTAWHQGSEQLALLRRHAVGRLPSGAWPAVDWVELAHRRFGHEPVLVTLPTAGGGHTVQVACPGAEVYRASAVSVPSFPF
ncbi:hypothetical protein ACH4E7_29305 [Kitasatospora sp. NPDC018058]|uniref:hypothetical protein n=1 Tax=Kitasatospora sp. NPDC018058 TaxID=3364025 RepID=UPI0037C0315A